MKIERHKIDDEYMKDMESRRSRSFRDLHDHKWVKEKASNLPMLATTAQEALAFGCLLDPHSSELPLAIQIGAEAIAGSFGTIQASTANPITVTLSGFEATYTSQVDESELNVLLWLKGFYLSLLGHETKSLQILCGMPTDRLKESSTKGGSYHYLYAESLKSFAAGRSDFVKNMLAALEATDPKRGDVFDADWTLHLHVPQMEVLIRAATHDAEFGKSLEQAVLLHKKYWSISKMNRRSPRGYISVELTALAMLGKERGLAFDVESPYLPLHLASHN